MYEDILPHYLALGVDYGFFMNSNPFEMKAYDRAFQIQRKLQDERDWFMGQYVMSAFGTVLANAFGSNKTAKYIEKPILSSIDETKSDPEANERLAVAEMQKFIAVLKQQGDLPETVIADL